MILRQYSGDRLLAATSVKTGNAMTTRLEKTIKREITVRGEALILTLAPEGVTITPKGRRNGKTFIWAELWSGEQEVAAQLRVSVAAARSVSYAYNAARLTISAAT